MQIFPNLKRNSNDHISKDTYIHKLDARVKILSVFILMVITACIKGWLSFLILAIFISLLHFFSQTSPFLTIKRLKTFKFFFILTGVMHFFFTPGEIFPYFPLEYMNVTYDGIEKGAIILGRLSFIIITTSIFTLTTSPKCIAKGLEDMFNPVKKILPGLGTFSTMVVLTIQFIPILLNLAENEIKRAKNSEGSQKRGLTARIRFLTKVTDSYFESVIKEVDRMCDAEEFW